MSWGKAILAGGVAGIVVNLVDWVLHGMILGPTYAEHAVFVQEEGSPLWFFVVSILIGVFAAILFAKTRGSWADGLKGGATYGFFLGMVAFWGNFYNPLVLEGFPYFLSWCWGGINLIDGVVGGAIIGLIYKRG